MLAPPLIFLIPELIRLTRQDPSVDLLFGSAIFLAFAVPVAFIAMLLFGLPYVLWLRFRGLLNTLSVCAGATVIGSIVFGLLSWLLTWDHRPPGMAQLALGAGLGFSAGVAFALAAGLTIRSSRTPIA